MTDPFMIFIERSLCDKNRFTLFYIKIFLRFTVIESLLTVQIGFEHDQQLPAIEFMLSSALSFINVKIRIIVCILTCINFLYQLR